VESHPEAPLVRPVAILAAADGAFFSAVW